MPIDDVRTICWFSCGAASAVATKLMLAERQPVSIVYCETGAEDEDNTRFLADYEVWFGQKVERIRSDEYRDTWDVWERRKYLAGVDGAPCTVELKIAPRLAYQRPTDIHVFGYTADAGDVARAKRMRGTYFEMAIHTPLIDRGITKAGCFAMVEGAGIRLPRVYPMGFANANCIPCVKATSPDYWALIRKCFPVIFLRMSALSRQLGVRLCRLHGERAFIDEIPDDWPVTQPISPACDFLCQIAEQDL